jgi:integrase
MASLEFVHFQPWKASLSDDGAAWGPDAARRHIDALPQLFWTDGSHWAEANLWALERSVLGGSKPATVLSLMRHLKAYADFLEQQELHWQHFPVRRDERVLVRFRGELIAKIGRSVLRSSTARSRMSAVIQFYRYARTHGLIGRDSPIWADRQVSLSWLDTTGFQRTMTRTSTDLTIPNRARPGLQLEDGLLPLSSRAMVELLQFSASRARELHLMLTLGFFTGARLGSILSLRRENLESARPDPHAPGFHLLRIGPGTGVKTKFDVTGNLLIHDALLADLRSYGGSTGRLHRQVRARPQDKSLLFLTRRSNAYSVNSVDRLIQESRREALREGMRFMEGFKFHQTRATFGTWLMQILLQVTSVAAAVAFVREAMLHKHESTTFRYVRFLENTRNKEKVAEAFSQIFSGIGLGEWGTRDV